MNKEANSSIIQNQIKDALLKTGEDDELKTLKMHLSRSYDYLITGEELFKMLRSYCENITDVYEIDILDEDASAWNQKTCKNWRLKKIPTIL